MVYLPPSDVLDRLSVFTAETLVDAIGDGSKFERAQVGSMSSTLGFLARETEHRDGSILEQRTALLNALDELETLGSDEAASFVANQREAVEAVEPRIGNTEAVQTVLLETMGDIRDAVEDGTFGPDTTEAREVLYDLFETRVESQLRVLGRGS